MVQTGILSGACAEDRNTAATPSSVPKAKPYLYMQLVSIRWTHRSGVSLMPLRLWRHMMRKHFVEEFK